MLVLWGINMETSRLSTVTSFVWLRRRRGDEVARFRLASMLVIVARWSADLIEIFIISGVSCTVMIDEE